MEARVGETKENKLRGMSLLFYSGEYHKSQTLKVRAEASKLRDRVSRFEESAPQSGIATQGSYRGVECGWVESRRPSFIEVLKESVERVDSSKSRHPRAES